ncbi:HNH endonuclease [Peribacillus frigoritolerans]|uniref:HNH endonuclease n=1 Tax=Peribacillus frigoritolerans TaxID=450367 RepID=UPI0025A2C481|nr:HNH endonuclease [Peribacillus frigoritolerans]MDM5313375.1 HNH endonuclease [Peribacillus frigoritolerans]
MNRLNVEQLKNRVELVNKHMELEGSSYDLEAGDVTIQSLIGNKGKRKLSTTQQGYQFYNLSHKGKHSTVYLHHIVMMLADAEEYIEQMAKGMTINHISGDKTDNRLSNLEYLSQSDNSVHAFAIGLNGKPLEAKITAYEAYEMLEGFYQSDKSLDELSEAFDIPVGSVNRILKGKSYTGLFVMFKNLNKDDVRPNHSKLTVGAVKQILDMYFNKGMKQGEIAKSHNVARSTVGMIVRGRRWADVFEEFTANRKEVIA